MYIAGEGEVALVQLVHACWPACTASQPKKHWNEWAERFSCVETTSTVLQKRMSSNILCRSTASRVCASHHGMPRR
jgi:hypothetical protein